MTENCQGKDKILELFRVPVSDARQVDRSQVFAARTLPQHRLGQPHRRCPDGAVFRDSDSTLEAHPRYTVHNELSITLRTLRYVIAGAESGTVYFLLWCPMPEKATDTRE